MADVVKIVECPRDAWQGLPGMIPADVKARYLRSLVDVGFRHIDAVSFVSPAAVLKDSGRTVTRESAMAKLFASEVAVRICNEAVQLFGGYGFIKDYPAEKFYRDVKLCTIGEGTSEIQRMVIARELLKVQPSRG